MRILFYDDVAPDDYNTIMLGTRAMGGTESTVLKIATGLAMQKHVVVLANHKNTRTYTMNDVVYSRIEPKLFKEKFDAIVVLRNPNTAHAVLRPLYPSTPIFVWCHDLPGDWLTMPAKEIMAKKLVLIAVSDWHKTQIQERLRGRGYGVPRVVRVYNPIDEWLTPGDAGQVDKDALVWLSSPHKGLDRALYYFERLREWNPNFTLTVFNPNYIPMTGLNQDGVKYVGGKSQSQALEFAAKSLCLFYPNTVFPETFGLVLAECMAVGCPVITHTSGAAPEVTGGPPFTQDCTQIDKVMDTVMKWRNHRPVVQGRPEFRMSTVVSEWVKVLSDEAFHPGKLPY